ncbi:MAG: nucleotidyltransferase domain-containing protein [Ginsengibacter sp.]
MTDLASNRFGLTEKQYKLIENVIISINEIERVIIFGSRALDNFKPASDIDLAITGTNLNWNITNRFYSQLEDLPLPFMFDVLDYNLISNQALKSKIDTQGKIFFERQLKIA